MLKEWKFVYVLRLTKTKSRTMRTALKEILREEHALVLASETAQKQCHAVETNSLYLTHSC